MKKENDVGPEDELRREYDLAHLKGGVRGKYAKRYRTGTNVVRLERDVARVFKGEKAVNDALRSLIRLAKAQVARAH